jgi:hypothetical protein
MTDFRIIPKIDDFSGKEPARFGFIIENHPLGDTKTKKYVASWISYEKAIAAAYSLGMDHHVVEPVSIFYPDLRAML